MAKIVYPSFDAGAERIMLATAEFDGAAAKKADVEREEFQAYIDQWAGMPKDEPTVKKLGQCIRESQAFIDAKALGTLEGKTLTEYAQSAMRAFYWGVPYAQGLKNNPEMVLPWGGAKGGAKGKKSGGVQSTTREALDETLCKALQQARMLGLTEFAANILDLCIESLDGFEEPTAQ